MGKFQRLQKSAVVDGGGGRFAQPLALDVISCSSNHGGVKARSGMHTSVEHIRDSEGECGGHVRSHHAFDNTPYGGRYKIDV